MVSAVPSERAMLDRLEARWTKEGYQLIREPSGEQLPPFLRGFRPDAIAVGREPSLVIEIIRSRSPSAGTKVRQLQSLIEGHPDWRLEVIYAAAESIPLTAATDVDVRMALDEARRVAHIAPRSAILIAWSVFEAIGRRLEPNLTDRSLTPSALVDVMISTGRLPQTDSQFLRQMANTRNAVAHGRLDLTPSLAELQQLLDVCDRLSRESAAV